MRSRVLVLIPLFFGACAPAPSANTTPSAKSEPPPPDGIPWAPGERPSSTDETARDVEKYEREEAAEGVAYATDGITPARSTAICKGKESGALLDAVDKRAKQLATCEDRIAAGELANGDLIWTIRIDEKGNVASLALIKDSLGISAITTCGEQILRQSFYNTPPQGGCVEFKFPLQVRSQVESPSAEE